jgi:hypothetical protein
MCATGRPPWAATAIFTAIHLLEHVDILGRMIVGKGSRGNQDQARLKYLWRMVTAQESADYSSLEP